MGYLTPHFTLEEMQHSANANAIGIKNIIPIELIGNAQRVAEALELIRARFNRPIEVLSCYRSPKVNEIVGGSVKSAHMQALAADIRVKDVSVSTICNWCVEHIPYFDQIIYEFGEQGWTHLGFSNGLSRGEVLTAIKENGKTIYQKGIITL